MGTQFETVWKEFEENEISHSEAHYLLAITSFIEEGIKPRSADLARKLNVSRTAVSLQLRNLIQQRLVYLDPSSKLHLTTTGKAVVDGLISRRNIIQSFLRDFLEVSEKTALKDSCKIEHLISDETANALSKFLKGSKTK